jgi:putative acetyltransferase
LANNWQAGVSYPQILMDETVGVYRNTPLEGKPMSDSPTLTIRGLRTEDWDSLFVLCNLEDVILDSVEAPYLTEEAFRERFNAVIQSPHTLVAETGLPSGRKRIVGIAWLYALPNRLRHMGRIVLAVHPDYQETGTETTLLEAALDLADRWLGLRRLEVSVYTDCAAAVALYEHYGFQIEATRRRYAFRNGVYADAYLMARLRGHHQDGSPHD